MTVPYSELERFLLRLGFEPNMVREFTATPTDAKATLYRRDADGSKFCDPETGEPAVEVVEFKVGRA